MFETSFDTLLRGYKYLSACNCSLFSIHPQHLAFLLLILGKDKATISMTGIHQFAFGPRFPLPPKVASPSCHLKNSTNLESLVTNPKDELIPRLPNSLDQEPFLDPDSRLGLAYSAMVHTAVNWPMVVTLRSKTFQIKNIFSASKKPRVSGCENVKTPGVITPFSILRAIMDSTDILDALMLNCPDFPTLFALVVSCKAGKKAFEHHPQRIINAVLMKLPTEFRHLTLALIAFKDGSVGTKKSVRKLMRTWLTTKPMPVMDHFPHPLRIVRRLAHSFSAIDLFTDVIANNCVENSKDYQTIVASREGLDWHTVTHRANKHPLLNQTEWSDVPDDTQWELADMPSSDDQIRELTHPLNDRETYRIKRALLRYELFCSLFHSGPDIFCYTRPWAPRYDCFNYEQMIFDQYVNPWEIGEMAVITQFMFDVVRNAFFHEYLSVRYNEAYESCFTPSYIRDYGEDRHQDHKRAEPEFHRYVLRYMCQGLNLLKGIYEDRMKSHNELTKKYGRHPYNTTPLFIPYRYMEQTYGNYVTRPRYPWKPRYEWKDTPGMELPSKGWLNQNPRNVNAYWGQKWTRKIGYFIWDRELGNS